MTRYEYKVVPAPEQGKKGKGIKSAKGRFAFALESLMNELGAEGWDYVRADTLPFEERSGLTGKTVSYQNMLVFRRAMDAPQERRVEAPVASHAPTAPQPSPQIAPDRAMPEAPRVTRFSDPVVRAPAPPVSAIRAAPEPEPTADPTREAAAAAVAALSAYRGTTDREGGLAAE